MHLILQCRENHPREDRKYTHCFNVRYTDEKIKSIKKAREMNLTLQKDLESLDNETKKMLDEKYEVAVQSKIYLIYVLVLREGEMNGDGSCRKQSQTQFMLKS